LEYRFVSAEEFLQIIALILLPCIVSIPNFAYFLGKPKFWSRSLPRKTVVNFDEAFSILKQVK